MPIINKKYQCQAKCPMCGAKFISNNRELDGQYKWIGRGVKREYCQSCMRSITQDETTGQTKLKKTLRPVTQRRGITIAEKMENDKAIELMSWRLTHRCIDNAQICGLGGSV